MSANLRLSAPDWCFFRPKMDPSEYYGTLRSHGYEGVEMVDESRFAAARAAGLEILNLAGPGMTHGLNRMEHHESLLPEILDVVRLAAANEIGAVIVFSGNRDGQGDGEGIANVTRGLEQLLPEAERLGVELWFEMLCQRDHPDYQADRSAYGFELARRLGSAQLRILYDIYHMSQMGEDVLQDLDSQLPQVAHIHLANPPDRSCVRDDERVAFRKIRDRVQEAGYTGYWGMEFIPRTGELKEAGEAAGYFRG